MLILTRRINESIHIGDDIRVVLVDVKGRSAAIGVEAPGLEVLRSELIESGAKKPGGRPDDPREREGRVA